jgi:Fe-Mn family superoxide dismutase
MAYSVPPLPYAYDALEPHIDKLTMEIHHDKHHQAYVDKVNAALEGTPLTDAPIEDVLKDLSQVPDEKRAAVRNNGGGHYNHSLFWESMSPIGAHPPGSPSGALAQAIDSAFGSFADFQAKVKETGVNQFGSGWSWLVHDGSGLAVLGTPNQDNPISDGKTPLLGVDVWEHAYYLKYQNKRPDYIDAWWNTVDWGKVGERFAATT